MEKRSEDIVERIDGRADATVVLTCEHASNRLPPPWTWPDADRWLVDTHWAIDLGMAQVTRALAHELRAPAVLAGFSRLLCDVNRPLDADTLFRTTADGRAVALNADLRDEERQERINRLHVPYHDAVDDAVRRTPRAALLSMHSFTPVYEGGPARPMEIGVLFDREEAASAAMAESLAADGWKVALNEPYSGKGGFVYSAERHATTHGRKAFELEVRQDVATDQTLRARLIHSIVRSLGVAL